MTLCNLVLPDSPHIPPHIPPHILPSNKAPYTGNWIIRHEMDYQALFYPI